MHACSFNLLRGYMESSIILNSNNNNYLFDMKNNNLNHINPILAYIIENNYDFNKKKLKCNSKFYDLIQNKMPHVSDRDIDYQFQKFEYLKKHNYFEQIDSLQTRTARVTTENVIQYLKYLPGITLEMTDACNLDCKYCAYGEFYNHYDTRYRKQLEFASIKGLLDYYNDFLLSLKNDYPLNKQFFISFYGGEPLLNFETIKKTVDYARNLKLPNRIIKFTMTTNGILLDKYIDFFIENDFQLLISIDGNEYNNSYRVDKNGKNSFKLLYKNIKLIQNTNIRYFRNNVRFNCVLHNRNCYQEVVEFIKNEFQKEIQISELSSDNINESKIDEFNKMFRSSYKDFSGYINSCSNNKISSVNNMFILEIAKLIKNVSPFTFKNISNFYTNPLSNLLPTGSCPPFYRSIFLTINKKLLYCERVPHNRTLGSIDGNNNVNFDFNQIADQQNKLYEEVSNLCEKCYFSQFCDKCLLTDPMFKGCEKFKNKNEFIDYLNNLISNIEYNLNP